MVFTTPWFLLFSISTSIAYLLFSRYRVNRLIVLTLASIIFYINLAGVSAFTFVVLLATFTFFSGLCIANYRGLNKRILLVLCLSPAVVSLLYFNYFGFFNEIMQAGLNAAKVNYTEDSTNLIKSL